MNNTPLLACAAFRLCIFCFWFTLPLFVKGHTPAQTYSNAPDLALSVNASQLNPAQWSNTTITYTLTNTGPVTATGVAVRAGVCETIFFGQNSGLVYANTNFQTTMGTYGQVSQIWNIPSLGAGQTATLSITLFALTNQVRRVFGEVTGNYTDADSTPANWVDCTPDEDDEAVVILNANNGCAILVDLLGTTCNDNGTPNNPADDYYFANVSVGATGGACSSGFVFSGPGIPNGNAPYNSTVSIGPFPTSESSVPLGFGDSAGNNLAVSGINVVSPGQCSGGGSGCFLTALAVNPLCNNSGTPNNPNDDTFSYELLVTKSGSCGSQWTDGTNTYNYGTAVPYGSALISNGSFTVTVWDVANPNSTATAVVNPVPPCSNSSCSITGGILNVTCSDNGTPSIATDDLYSFFINLGKSGGSASNNQWTTTIANQTVSGSFGTPQQAGNYPISGGPVSFTVSVVNEPACGTVNFTVQPPAPCSNGGGSGQIDLSLTLQQLTANPAQWSNYSVKATVSNAGPQTATGVKVKFAKPAGVVYVGGNTHTVSQGTFNALSDEVWTVGSIPVNGSASLTVNYFLLNASAPTAYAQVTAASQTDSDSQPNNGTPPTPVQDDEAATSGGGPTPLPDLTIADLQIPNASTVAGGVLNYHFDTGNAGNAAVPCNFSIKSYISTDQTLSVNDIQDGTINTGNYGIGLVQNNIPGASTIPASLAAGSYFLIVKIDADNGVSESNENNNIVVKPFTVTTGGGGSTPDCNAITITPGQNKITIAGFSAPHVLIKVFKPNWQAAFECLDGACSNPLVVSGLSAGNHFVEVKLLNASWGEICKKTQTVNVTTLGGKNGSGALKIADDRQRLDFDNIYPNPAKYFVTLQIYSPEEQEAVLDFYDITGRPAHRMEVSLQVGKNMVEVPVFEWKSGSYNMIARGKGLPAYGRFFKAWEE